MDENLDGDFFRGFLSLIECLLNVVRKKIVYILVFLKNGYLIRSFNDFVGLKE